MVLDLTAGTAGVPESIERFAREMVAPQAARSTSPASFPLDVMRAAAGARPARRDDSHGLGRRRARLRQLRAGDRSDRAGQRDGGGVARRHQLARRRTARARRQRARRRNSGCARSASGEAIGAFALSEPDAGTDAANQQTTAVRGRRRLSHHGTQGLGGERGGGARGDRLCATHPAADRRGRSGVTAFLVPMDTPGITRRRATNRSGVRGLGCMDLEFDIAVGDDQVLGAVDQGFRLAMWALEGGRVAIAAQALGIGEAALGEAIAHAKAREQFGQPIANYQAIQWMLADSATELAAARMLTWKAARREGSQERGTFEASMAKLAASEAAHKAADRAMQILASAGYRRGSVVERLFRDVRATEIYQGTSEAQRMIIAGGTGDVGNRVFGIG